MQILRILQVILAILVTAFVLIQTKGGGFTQSVGSSISFYRSRRGLEKGVFIFTIIASFALVINSLVLVIIG